MKLAFRALVALFFSCTPPSASTAPTAGTPSPNSATPPSAEAASTPSASVPSLAPSAGGDATDGLVGKPAPDFTTTAHDGTVVHLAALHGKPVVVYFYPKDETPGCTKEACSFRDAWQRIAKTGAVLLGVSADSRESHLAFALHYNLPFLLLSDPDGTIARLYDVPFEGHHRRQTFVIGTDGTVRNVYRKVDVTVHAAQILEDLRHAN